MMHAEPTAEEIQRVADALVKRKNVKESSGPHAICDCVYCGKKEHLYYNLITGLHDCKVCGESGNAWKLASHLGIRLREKRIVRSATTVLKTSVRKSLLPTKIKTSGITIEQVDARHERLFKVDDEEGKRVLDYLHGRGIEDAAIKHFRLGVAYIRDGGAKDLAVGIPTIVDGKVAVIKMRNIDPNCEKSKRFRRTKGGASLLFNGESLKDRRRIVLCEGELDAISLWQSGVTAVASTSLGAKGDVPEEWKEVLADAEDIVLWYDDDDAGSTAIEGLSAALGSHRVRIASIPDDVIALATKTLGKPAKDVNDLVRCHIDGAAICKIVDGARGLEMGTLVRPSAYNDAMMKLIDGADTSLGDSTGFPSLDAVIKGVRPGELTIVTGHTGHGKSSLVSAMLEDGARRGISCLAVFLEEGPQAFVRGMFQRRFGQPVSSIKGEDKRAKAYEVLSTLDENPIWLFDAYGRVSLDDVIDGITYAVHRLGVKWVMIDHLHFIECIAGMDEVKFLDHAANTFAETAVRLNVHIFLLAHPKGSVELSTIPTGGSIKGSSSIKQAAFNGITVFRIRDQLGADSPGKIRLKDGEERRVEVKLESSDSLVYVWKARHPEAREGAVVLRFCADDLSFRDKEFATAAKEEMRPAWSDDTDDESTIDDLFGNTN